MQPIAFVKKDHCSVLTAAFEAASMIRMKYACLYEMLCFLLMGLNGDTFATCSPTG